MLPSSFAQIGKILGASTPSSVKSVAPPFPVAVDQLRLLDNLKPSLVASDVPYTVSTSHRLEATSADSFIFPNFHSEIGFPQEDFQPWVQSFSVDAPRFTLAAEEIHSVHPANNSTGAFDYQLPHIVFTKRTLPWERQLHGQDNAVPWLALLVLSDEDFYEEKDEKGAKIFIRSKIAKDFGVSALPSESLRPKLKMLAREEATPCQSIKLTAKAFVNIAPQLAELKYLAHCRQVNSTGKVASEMIEPGSYSVILANRFPLGVQTDSLASGATRQNRVHLVSLEGLEPYLTSTPLPDSIESVELVSLVCWSFNCVADNSENFRALVQALIPQSTAGESSWSNVRKPRPQNYQELLLRISTPLPEDKETPDEVQESCTRLMNGYVPLAYHLPSGEETLAWYRGPFVPGMALALPRQQELFSVEKVTSADSLKIYDPKYGVFDLSYAAAWQLGRSLAMADQTLVTNLISYRNTLQQAAKKELSVKGGKLQLAQHLPNIIANLQRLSIVKLTAAPQALAQEEKSEAAPTKLSTSSRANKLTVNKSVYALLQKGSEAPDSAASVINACQQWLLNLRQLSSVPFHYLVAKEELLPEESMRFFHVDSNWLDVLMGGALNVGIDDDHDVAVNVTLFNQLRAQMTANKTEPVAGFLLRSRLVSGWPALHVRTVEDDLTPANTKILRMESLSKDVLLCLFDSIPPKIVISEPSEQLAFGLTGDSFKEGFIELRSLSAADLGSGLIAKAPFKLEPRFFRDKKLDGSGALDVLELKAGLESALSAEPAKQSLQPGGLHPSELGLLLVRSPEEVIFKATPAAEVFSYVQKTFLPPIKNANIIYKVGTSTVIPALPIPYPGVITAIHIAVRSSGNSQFFLEVFSRPSLGDTKFDVISTSPFNVDFSQHDIQTVALNNINVRAGEYVGIRVDKNFIWLAWEDGPQNPMWWAYNPATREPGALVKMNSCGWNLSIATWQENHSPQLEAKSTASMSLKNSTGKDATQVVTPFWLNLQQARMNVGEQATILADHKQITLTR